MIVKAPYLQDVPLSFYFLNFPPETYCVCGWFPLAIGYKTSFAHEGDHVDVTSCSEGCMCNITSYGNVELCRKKFLASTSSEPIFLEFTLAQNLASMENYMNPRVLFQRTMILYDLHGSERGWITIHTLAVSEAELSRCTWGGDGVDSDKMTKRFWHGMVFCRCHRWLYHVRPYSSDHTFLDFWERCFELNRRGLIMSDRFLRVASPCGSKVDGAHKLRD